MPARNAPCPCGSGNKYKHCCAGKTPVHKQPRLTGALIIALVVAGLVMLGIAMSNTGSSELHPAPPGPAPPGKVWSPEHGHWHDAR